VDDGIWLLSGHAAVVAVVVVLDGWTGRRNWMKSVRLGESNCSGFCQ